MVSCSHWNWRIVLGSIILRWGNFTANELSLMSSFDACKPINLRDWQPASQPAKKKGHLAVVTFFLVGFILAALPPNINRWELHAITFDVGC